MKKMMMFAALAAVGMIAGCFTSATARTETKHPDGSVTVSVVKVIGTGDKASQVAAEGLFADGTADDLGAGVKTANARQTSTGIDGTLNGVAAVGAAYLAGRNSAAAYLPQGGVSRDESGGAAVAGGDTVYSDEAFGAVPGADGSGVYGKPGCGNCRAWLSAHAGSGLINLNTPEYRTTMWKALRARGYTGEGVDLPVKITATGYTQLAK